jgi:hypothetical protein
VGPFLQLSQANSPFTGRLLRRFPDLGARRLVNQAMHQGATEYLGDLKANPPYCFAKHLVDAATT